MLLYTVFINSGNVKFIQDDLPIRVGIIEAEKKRTTYSPKYAHRRLRIEDEGKVLLDDGYIMYVSAYWGFTSNKEDVPRLAASVLTAVRAKQVKICHEMESKLKALDSYRVSAATGSYDESLLTFNFKED